MKSGNPPEAMAKKHKKIQLITLFLLLIVSLLFISDSLSLLLPNPSSHTHRSSLLETPIPIPIPLPNQTAPNPTTLKHLVFGIASCSDQWPRRSSYLNYWWRPHQSRGFVWLDQKVTTPNFNRTGYPVLKLSEDTSGFEYRNKWGTRSGLRITRIVSEMVRMGLKDVRWFVMGDDDTVFFPDNLIRVLNKYDHNEMYYIGSNSETHVQNIHFSYGMAYGGGGFAISYPLAVELEKMQDRCIPKHASLYGSDDRIHACLTELGVPLTKEPGFHQYDVLGNIFGLLAAHPVAPLVTLHHLDIVEPIFPTSTRLQSLRKLAIPASLDSASLMQQSICYDNSRNWTISVSWGYAVQIFRGKILPLELEKPARTFTDWLSRDEEDAFSFNTRPLEWHPCQKPYVYYLRNAESNSNTSTSTSRYALHNNRSKPWCWWEMANPSKILNVVVYKKLDPHLWDKAPRRNCCRVLASRKDDTLEIDVGICRQGEVIEAKW